MSKYDPLQQHLAAQPATVTDVTLSFGKGCATQVIKTNGAWCAGDWFHTGPKI